MPAQDFSPPGPTEPGQTRSQAYFTAGDHVVGYLVASTPAAAAPMLRDISANAAEWNLGAVEAAYRDTGWDGARPGLDQAITDVRARKAHGVIVPTRQHLSADDTTRASWLAQIRPAGGVVHHVHADPPHAGPTVGRSHKDHKDHRS